MSKRYDLLLDGINQRSNPDSLQMKVMFSEENATSRLFESKKLSNADVYNYIKKAMKGVPAQYTTNSKSAADKVESHLQKSHGLEVNFKRQGSVMTNTHILKDNDIDLVQITSKSKGVDHKKLKISLDNSSTLNTNEYKNLKKHFTDFKQYEGSQIYDLKVLRKKSEEVLTATYNKVDINKDNSISVLVSAPKRDVDVVTASYYKGIDYMKTNLDYRRGIQIYNKKSNSLSDVDYPFWSIKRINDKSIITNQRLKNMIRFLKNIKYDCEHIDNKGAIRSFHINAICYNINIEKYQYLHFLDLLPVLNDELLQILNNKVYRDSIRSVDGTEVIFIKNSNQKLEEIKFLQDEIFQILSDLQTNNQILL